MRKEIIDLITLKSEGGYWDFKQEWYSNNSDLLHDIICMANNIEDRDAFIIIGVTDNGEICGVTENNRKNQQNLVDFLRGVKFAGDRRPTVLLTKFNISENEIDVIVIKNTLNTPYYLTDDYNGVYKGNVYTRISDTNTPKNKTADIDKTEFLWKKRFGLNLPVFSLAKLLLTESEYWIQRYDEILSQTIFYHKARPEFTVEITDYLNNGNRTDKPNFWYFYLYNALGINIHPKIFFQHLVIKYHTTILYETDILSCDEGNYKTICFENETLYKIKYEGGFNKGLVVAYLILDSEQAHIYNFINGQFLINKKNNSDKREVDDVVLFFYNEKEKNDFFNMVNDKLDDFMICFQPKSPPDSVLRDNDDGYDIGMSLRGSKILKKWFEAWKATKGID